jgi:hypothetical protein
MRFGHAAPLGVGVLTVLAACTSSGNVATPVDGGVVHDGGSIEAGADGGVALGPTARFKLAGATPPQFLDVPFPSDAYVASGAIVNPLPGLDNFVARNSSYISHALGTMNGFSRVALSIFAVDDTAQPPNPDGSLVSALIDPTSLPVAETDCTTATSSVYVLDLAPGASPAILPCRTEFHDDQPGASTTPVIAAGPARGVLLQESHAYAVVLTTRVKDTKGHALLASADMNTVASGAASASGAIGTIYTQAYASAAKVLAANLATDGAKIVAIAPYTTMHKTGELFAMREALETAPVPTLAWDAATMAPMGASKFAKAVNGVTPAGFTASTDAWLGVATQKLPDGTDLPDDNQPIRAHDQLAAVGTAVFTATSYLQVKPTGYSDPAHGTFAYDSSGNPVPQAPVKIWITFGVPTTPMPVGGYPTVILQHGISSSRRWIMGIANVFASHGWMFAAIDSVTFGARAPEPSNSADKINDFADGSGATYAGPDGFADVDNGSTDFFGNLLNVGAIGDQFRQAGFDGAQVVKLLRSNPDLSALNTGSGVPMIDATRIGYVADSLGAMQGTIAAAIEPRVKAWFFNVNGGSLFHELVAHSPDISIDLGAAATLNFGLSGDLFSWSHPLMAVLQQTVEPGDPISYASYLTLAPKTIAGLAPQPRNVLQTEVIWDEVVTDEAAEALARAEGWGLAVPNVGSNADLIDPSNPTGNLRKTPLANISPDANGAIHDTPLTGSTAVVVQCSPCAHGSDLDDSRGEDDYVLPYEPPIESAPNPLVFTQDYRSIQVMVGSFMNDAFNGTVPRVVGITPPVRNR